MNDSAEVGGKTCFQARTMRRTQETVVCELPKGGALSKGGGNGGCTLDGT